MDGVPQRTVSPSAAPATRTLRPVEAVGAYLPQDPFGPMTPSPTSVAHRSAPPAKFSK